MFDTTGILLIVFSVITFLLIPILGYIIYRFRQKKRYQKSELGLYNQQHGIAKYGDAFLLYFLIFILFAAVIGFFFCVGMLSTGTGLII